MSPGQKKLNDIEASIHSIQVGFDLMANRRAVVSPVVGMAMVRREGVGNGQQSVAVGSDDSGRGQSGSREAAMEVISPNFVSSSSARKQTSVTSTREINLQNNGVSLRNESFKSRDTPRAGKKVDTNFADKSSTSNNTKRDSNETPPTSTVRTSTLRLLFSGISDTPVKSHSHSSIPTSRDKSKVTGMKEQFERHETSLDSNPPSEQTAVMSGRKSSYLTNNNQSEEDEALPKLPQDKIKVSGMKQHFERQESLGYLTPRPDPIASVFSRTYSFSADNNISEEDDVPILQQERSKVSGMKEHFERQERLGYLTSRPDPIASVFSRTYSHSVDNDNPDEDAPILQQDRSKVTGMREKFEQSSPLEPTANDFRSTPGHSRNYKSEDARYGHSSYRDFNAQSSEPVECNNQYGTKEHCSSPRNFTLDHLDVANLVRQSLYQKSVSSIIDTDDTSTDITGGYDEEYIMSSLLMSPALITKRYLQALKAIELRNWDQVMYLINADPWLMEMKDLRNDQFLVHVLALFGAGQYDDNEEAAQPAPKELIETMLEHDPSVAHKLDYEGNLPLHMAAASGNIAMIRELNVRFPEAASVQNHDGFLPLHLAIMSCALFPTGEEAVSLILELFDGGVCVKDNDGNTPLHTAARTLKGDVGVDVIYQLMAVCHNLADNDPVQLRESMGGNIKKPKQFDDTATVITTTTDHSTDASGLDDSFPGSLFCLTKNNSGDTPLARAIKSLAGWQVIEALLSMDGGHLAALEKNRASQNALHLALEIDFNDASAVLAILKAVPSAASIADGSGILPIQLACMNCLQREIILAIAIIDLPIDLGARQEAILREGYGASWWFLVCESDDRYVDIVTEILSMCSHPQKTALCLTRVSYSGINKSAIVGATPKCKIALMGSLRFLGRFEFGDQNMIELSCESTHQFSAIDYGTHETPFDGGRKVSLRCYMNDIDYLKETQHLHQAPLDEMLFEDLDFFSLTECEPNTPHDIRVKHCVSITTPSMSLARVIAGMPKNHKYRRDANSLGRYFGKVKHILLQTAKALSHLHEIGIVHGNVDSSHIGKFGDKWRLTGLLGSCVTGSKLPSHCVGLHSPPEVLLSDDSILALPFIDVWSFGKLMYEVFVGDSLFTPFQQDGDETITIISWDESHQTIIADELFQARIGSVGIDLITGCLNPRDQDRPDTMLSVVHHPFWNDANAFDIH